MNYSDVQSQILDLPDAFQRLGPQFAALVSAFTASMSRSTRAIDQIAGQINIQTARWGWLDSIGKLYGILRNQFETDPQYRVRLLGTLSTTTGTPTSIVNFLKLSLNLNTSVTENFSLVSYQINFFTPPSSQMLQNVAINLVRVRPAGIPFLPFFTLTGGLFLDTLNYLGGKLVTGSYLSKPSVSVNLTLAENTNNPQPLLPVVYLQDPYIRGIAQASFPL